MSTIALGDQALPLDVPGLRRLTAPPSAGTGPDRAGLLAPLLRALDGARRPVLLVPDHTRAPGALWALPALCAAAPRARVVIASGTHAPMTPGAVRAHLPAPVPRDRVHVHDVTRGPYADLGDGHAILRLVADADVVVAVSQMVLHYLAGFGGGRKMLFPGVACAQTARWVHAASLSATSRGRPATVALGVLDENPLHARIEALCHRLTGELWGVCSVLEGGRLVDATAGELFAHHRELAVRYRANKTVSVTARPNRVVVSAGPASSSRDLVQAHKALYTAAQLCAEGGQILLVAGLGDRAPGAVERLVADRDADSLLADALHDFAIPKQTAWSIKDILARFEVTVCSPLAPARVHRWGARAIAPGALPATVRAWCADDDETVWLDSGPVRFVFGAQSARR